MNFLVKDYIVFFVVDLMPETYSAQHVFVKEKVRMINILSSYFSKHII